MAGGEEKEPKSVKERWLPVLGERASFGVLRRDGVIVYESDALLATLGWRPEEVLGQRGRVFLHPDSLDDAWALANAAWEGTSGVTDVRYLHKDGSVRWMQLHATRLDDQHLLLYRRDVTPRHDAERALDRSNQLLEAVAAIQAEYIESPSVVPFQRLLDAFVRCTESTEGAIVLPVDPALRDPRVRVVAQTERAASVMFCVNELEERIGGGATIERTGELAYVPLCGPDATLRAVVILGGRRGGYDSSTADLCRPLVVTALRLLESHRDRRRHVEAEQEVELLKTLAFAVAEAKDLDSALAVIVRTFVDHTGWELGQTWVPTMDRLRLESTSAWFARDARFGAFHEASRKLQFGPGEGMLGRVWMTKKPWWVDAPEAAQRGFPRVALAAEAGLVVSFCVPIVADGEVVALLEFFSTRHRLEDQRTLSVVAACATQVASILERKRVERGFEVFAGALRDMHDAATVTTRRGGELVLEYANPAYRRLTGFDPADIVGRDPTFLYGPATDMSVVEELAKESLAGRSVRVEMFLYDKDGQAREFELSNTPVPSADGTESKHLTIWRELGTSRKSRSEPLPPATIARELEIAWRQTVDAIDLPLVIVAPSRLATAINRAAAALIGKSPDEIVGRALSDFGAGEPWTSAHDLLPEVLRAGRGRTLAVPDVTRGKSWELSLAVLADRRGAVVIVRDVATSERLRTSYNDAEIAGALGRFVGGIAHEVRNPLFGMGATLDAFEMRLGERQEFREYVPVLRGELARLAELANDLLAYGKPPRLAPAVHLLARILDEVVARVGDFAKKSGVALSRERAPAELVVRVDRARLVEALIVLVETAILRSPREGAVTVACRSDGGRGVLEIADGGPEIPTADLRRMFTPFFFRRAGGTGIGLSIVQRVVEQHDGSVSIDNRADGGVVIAVTLPLEATDGR